MHIYISYTLHTNDVASTSCIIIQSLKSQVNYTNVTEKYQTSTHYSYVCIYILENVMHETNRISMFNHLQF